MKSYISVCPSGSYLNSNNGDACEVCPADTYGSGSNAKSCTNCPSGTNTQQQTGQISINACGKQFIKTCCISDFIMLETQSNLHAKLLPRSIEVL